MRIVESSDVRGVDDLNDSLQSVKRPKLDDDFSDAEDGSDRRRHVKQIHILAEVLDVLEIGGREPKMSEFCC